MQAGTPGFVGARLREAREARAITMGALAEMLNVTRASVSLYELGSRSPSPEVMLKIGSTLNFPAPFFLRPTAEPNERTVFYRSMNATTKTARQKAEKRLGWLSELVSYLRGFVDFPSVRFPEIAPRPLEDWSFEEIEELAAHTRRLWELGDGPISNMAWLLENNGAIISRTRLEVSGLDALSTFDKDDEHRPYAILNSNRGTAARWRFDLAHELGHALLHRTIDPARLRRTPDFALMEQQAHRFAAGFLLPARSFIDDFYSATLNALVELKSKWRVSVRMMIVRAQQLSLISPETTRRLLMNCGRRGWNVTEPLDDKLPIEQPMLLRRAMELLIERGLQTVESIRGAIPLAPLDLEELAGVPPGMLGGPRSEIRIFEPSVSPREAPKRVTASKVTPFRRR